MLDLIADLLLSLFEEEPKERNIHDDFVCLLEKVIEGCKIRIESLEEQEKDIKEYMSQLSRDERRFYLKKVGVEKGLSSELISLRNDHREMTFTYDLLTKDTFAKTNEEFATFIKQLFLFILFDNDLPSDCKDYSNVDLDMYRKLIKEQIIKSKKNNVICKFLSYFDDNGEVIKDRIIELNILLIKLRNNSNADIIDKDLYRQLFIDDKSLEEERKRVRQLRDQEIEKQKELKRQAREKEQHKSSERQTSIPTSLPKYEYTKKEVEKYFDLRSRTLKSDAIKLISWDELKPLLLEVPEMTKGELYRIKDTYDYFYLMDIVERVLTKEDYRNFLIAFKENEDIREDVEELIFSEEIQSMSDQEISTELMNIVRIDKNDSISNFIIFTNPNLLDNEVERINASSDNPEPLNKNILHQLYSLQAHPTSELRKGGTAIFHPIKYNRNDDFILPNGMKGYRFGRRKSKVCFFKASICSENKEILEKYYNLEKLNDLIIVFGLGNVWAEQETDLYMRCIRTAEDDYERIEMISKILSVPFTEESLKFITSLIDSTNQNISDYRNKYNVGNTLDQ